MIRIKDKTSKAVLQLGLAFFGLQLLAWLFFWKKLPPEVPLFYSRPWGQKQLVGPIILAILPGFSLLVMTINLIFASIIISKQKLAGQLLITFGTIFSFFCLVTLAKIILLVI